MGDGKLPPDVRLLCVLESFRKSDSALCGARRPASRKRAMAGPRAPPPFPALLSLVNARCERGAVAGTGGVSRSITSWEIDLLDERRVARIAPDRVQKGVTPHSGDAWVFHRQP